MQVADLYAKLSLKPNTQSFSAANRLLGGVKTALIGIASFQTARWFAGLVKGTVDSASAFVEMSQKIGIAIEPLQELNFAAKQSGSSAEGLQIALKKLSVGAFDAAQGSKEQRKLFKLLGVEYKAVANGTLSLEGALGQIANKFQAMPDGAEKSALATKAFGRSGQELIPLLNEGAGGIEKLRTRARELGIVLEEDTAKSLEAFGDELDEQKAAIGGLKNQIAIALLPTLRKYVPLITQWIGKNRQLIKTKIEAFVKLLVRAVIFLTKNLDKLIPIAKAAVIVILAMKVASLSLLTPFNLIIAAVLGIATVLAKAFDVDVLTVFAAAAQVIVDAISAMVKGVQDLKSIFDYFTEEDKLKDEREARKRFKKISDTRLVEIAAGGDEEALLEVRRRDADTRRIEANAAAREQAGLTSTPDLVRTPAFRADQPFVPSIRATINVSSPNADPVAVAKQVAREIENLVRTADAAMAPGL